VAEVRTAETDLGGNAVVFKIHQYGRCRLDAIVGCTAYSHWMRTCQLPDNNNTRKSKINLNIIQCYATTNDADDEKKVCLPTTADSPRQKKEKKI
jgi:hypothetical protein